MSGSSPSFPCKEKNSFKVKGQKNEFFAIFSKTVSFIIKVPQRKIVDHKIIHKKCINTFFLRASVSEI